MTPQKRTRYRIAVYGVISLLAATLALSGLLVNNIHIQTILFNLATEFAGAAVIFFLVDMFFQIDERETIADRLENATNNIERKLAVFADSSNDMNLELAQRFLNARSIDLLGYSRLATMKRNQKLFSALLEQGSDIRLLLLHPRKRSLDLVQHELDVPIQDDILDSIEILNTLKTGCSRKNCASFRGTGFLPSYSLTLIDRNYDTGCIFIEFYPLGRVAVPTVDQRWIRLEAAKERSTF
jgi:hypothetical protein